jgi:DNA-binding response OmpR family regulator
VITAKGSGATAQSGKAQRVLLAQADGASAAALCRFLLARGLEVDWAGDVNRLDPLLARREHAILVLDIALPGTDGVAWLARRNRRSVMPVIALAPDGHLDGRVRALRAGADDCLVRPVAFEELHARMLAILRRGPAYGAAAGGRLVVQDLVLDPNRRTASRGGTRLALSALEYKLLAALMRNPGHVVSRASLAESVWGDVDDIDLRVVEVAICRLRTKVDKPYTTKLVRTLRGAGYLLDTAHGKPVRGGVSVDHLASEGA